MNSREFIIKSERDMVNLGESVGKRIFPGAVISLYGGLGAGKTTFVKGLGRALNIHDVSSPTFAIVNEHAGDMPLYHFDAYRLNNADELYDIAFEDYLLKSGAIVIEWADIVKDALPGERLEINIDGSGAEARRVSINACGAKYINLLQAI